VFPEILKEFGLRSVLVFLLYFVTPLFSSRKMAAVGAPIPLVNAANNASLPFVAAIPAGAAPVGPVVVGNASKRARRVHTFGSTAVEEGQAEIHRHEVTHQALGIGLSIDCFSIQSISAQECCS